MRLFDGEQTLVRIFLREGDNGQGRRPRRIRQRGWPCVVALLVLAESAQRLAQPVANPAHARIENELYPSAVARSV